MGRRGGGGGGRLTGRRASTGTSSCSDSLQLGIAHQPPEMQVHGTTKRTAEKYKEEATALTSIDEDSDKVVAKVATFKAQLVP